jgi:hypothetical protein
LKHSDTLTALAGARWHTGQEDWQPRSESSDGGRGGVSGVAAAVRETTRAGHRRAQERAGYIDEPAQQPAKRATRKRAGRGVEAEKCTATKVAHGRGPK